MYKVKYLQEELTSLFRTRILEDGNPAEDAMDYLGNIDFHALTQAVQDKARTAYTYITPVSYTHLTLPTNSRV